MPTKSEHSLTRSERELEEALRTLRPSSPSVDPIALAFAAGATSARRTLWMWRSAAALLCVALGLSIVARSRQLWRTDPTPVTPSLARETPAPSVPSTTFTYVHQLRSAGAYLRLRNRVLTHGFEALHEPIHAPSAAAADQPIPRAIDGGNWRPL